ncbi:Protein of unknown function [Acinetobacter marinus]|uniref:DUF3298 domain-containing protein n=1 Tax=Acinetobacter marinus TaxID=281375 RepID=A0A1G6MMC1_9GAMM|nr:RsiV family protein [Acinetobacter marinus]SDC56105.1 Protein of unknown function [Acinetobacter marinus]
MKHVPSTAQASRQHASRHGLANTQHATQMTRQKFKPFQLLALSLAMALSLSACQKKPEAKPEQSTHTEQTAEVGLQAKIEDVPVQIPACEGEVCPEITIQHLSSNYPKLDQAVDLYILNYVKNLVRGFDMTTVSHQQRQDDQNADGKNPVADAKAAESAPQPAENKTINRIEAEKAETLTQANNQPNELQPYLDQFLLLSNEVKQLGSAAKLTLFLKPQVLNPKGPIATVVVNAENYVGGAHGSAAQQYFNFELETETLLSLDEILEQGQRAKFNDLAHQAFEQWIKSTQPDMDVDEYQKLWKFTSTDNFYLSPTGLILQYGEYEIGPYVVGLPRLVIPYEYLHGVIKDQYLPIQAKAELAKAEQQKADSTHVQAEKSASK